MEWMQIHDFLYGWGFESGDRRIWLRELSQIGLQLPQNPSQSDLEADYATLQVHRPRSTKKLKSVPVSFDRIRLPAIQQPYPAL